MAALELTTTGSGSGSGYGYGYGSGYGSGSGSGYGYGSGSGSGSGYGLTATYSNHPSIPKGEKVTIGIWRSDNDGNPANGGSGTKATPGAVHEVEGPIRACKHGLHIETEDFVRWRGERWWVAALIGEVQMYDTKAVGTKRIILEELEAVA